MAPPDICSIRRHAVAVQPAQRDGLEDEQVKGAGEQFGRRRHRTPGELRAKQDSLLSCQGEASAGIASRCGLPIKERPSPRHEPRRGMRSSIAVAVSLALTSAPSWRADPSTVLRGRARSAHDIARARRSAACRGDRSDRLTTLAESPVVAGIAGDPSTYFVAGANGDHQTHQRRYDVQARLRRAVRRVDRGDQWRPRA